MILGIQNLPHYRDYFMFVLKLRKSQIFSLSSHVMIITNKSRPRKIITHSAAHISFGLEKQKPC